MEYQCSLKKKRFEVLGSLAEEMVEDHWQELKKIWTDTCQEVLGKRTREHKEWSQSQSESEEEHQSR